MALPEAQLYVVVATFIAVTAMTAADIRDKVRLLPRASISALALILLSGSWVAGLHIIFAVIGINDFGALSPWAAAGMVAHCLVVLFLLVVVSVWYSAIAMYKETPAGQPTAPATNP